MMNTHTEGTRFSKGAGGACLALALALSGCSYAPTTAYPGAYSGNYPMEGNGQQPAYPTGSMQGTGVEWGRVAGVDFMPAGSQASTNNPMNNGVVGAVLGAVVGGVVGRQIGGGSGRDAATLIGAGAGAYAGNRIARNAEGASLAPGYRVTIQTDGGTWRAFEVPNGNELRVGERVRVENGVIYKM